jgi:1,4-alpha-glucan branching enzyme
MSITKKSLKSKPITKVTFRLPAEMGRDAREVCLVGEFNNWNTRANPMKKLKSGEFTATVDLSRGAKYDFRYLIDGATWENDWEADEYRPSGLGNTENSVVVV